MMQELWSFKESKSMSLKDKRRNKRAAQILALMAEKPDSSIPQAAEGSLADSKAIYRFVNSTEIDEQDILEGHYAATVERISQEKEMIVITSDGMDYSFTNLPHTDGLGTLANSPDSLGIKLHNTFAFSKNSIPLGLLHQAFWIRDKSTYGKAKNRQNRNIEDKESYHWIESINQAEKRLPEGVGYHFIGDGAADIYDVFATKRRSNSSLLIHLVQNRKILDEKDKIFEKLEKSEAIGRVEKKLSRRANFPERTVTLEIKITTVQIMPPQHRRSTGLKKSIITHAILAKEIASDISVDQPIVWRLLTTDPVGSLDNAIAKIDLYSMRWLIERYHYLLKQGCRVEKLQMESVDNLKRTAALYAIVAWRLMHITYFARIEPDATCTKILSEDEWKALCCYHKKKPVPPENPPTIKVVVRMIAKLGGFLGRKSDGEPGSKVIWRGLFVLDGIVETYRIFKG
jgi:hypothetical protein